LKELDADPALKERGFKPHLHAAKSTAALQSAEKLKIRIRGSA
jgi:hypothetical protein